MLVVWWALHGGLLCASPGWMRVPPHRGCLVILRTASLTGEKWVLFQGRTTPWRQCPALLTWVTKRVSMKPSSEVSQQWGKAPCWWDGDLLPCVLRRAGAAWPPQLAVPPHTGLLLAVLGLLHVEGPAALQRYHCGATASRGLLSVALCYDSHYGFKWLIFHLTVLLWLIKHLELCSSKCITLLQQYTNLFLWRLYSTKDSCCR